MSFGRAGTLNSGAGTHDLRGVNADVLPGGWDGIFNIGNYQGNGMRLDNMVTYQTPTAAGFTGYLQYSFANDTTDGDDDSRPNERSNNRYFAGGLTYNNGPLGVVVIYDTLMFRHYSDSQVGDVGGNDANVGDSRVLSVGGHYDFGSFKLTAFGQYVKGSRSGFGDGLGYSVPFWSDDSQFRTFYYDADGYNLHIGAQIPMASWGRLYLGAYYGYLEANDDSLNSAAKNINLLVGHEYDFTKRTTLYSGVAYKQLKNENDNGKLGDMKATQVIVGLRHIF